MPKIKGAVMPTSNNPIMSYFSYAHLPAHLKGVSQVIAVVAELLNEQLPDDAEKQVGLRKLLEAKDCFVRSALKEPNILEIGKISDGFHTFNELYAHRMELFAVICHQNHSRAWKSKLHHDGTMFDGYFIVGVDTPLGQFTYHYQMDNWNKFDVIELDLAPEWDGHSSDDVTRLHSLDSHIVKYLGEPKLMSNEEFQRLYMCTPKASLELQSSRETTDQGAE